MSSTAANSASIGIERIIELIPHRYPFLLIDRLEDVVLDEQAVGVKNVTINEPFFQGHFPRHPIMPGVLIIEAMAQTATVLVMETLGIDEGEKLVYFMSVDGARFRKPVIPGDSLRIHVRKQRQRGAVWKFKGEAKVDGAIVSEAVFSAMIVEP